SRAGRDHDGRDQHAKHHTPEDHDADRCQQQDRSDMLELQGRSMGGEHLSLLSGLSPSRRARPRSAAAPTWAVAFRPEVGNMILSADPPCYGLGSGVVGTVDAPNIGRAFVCGFLRSGAAPCTWGLRARYELPGARWAIGRLLSAARSAWRRLSRWPSATC